MSSVRIAATVFFVATLVSASGAFAETASAPIAPEPVVAPEGPLAPSGTEPGSTPAGAFLPFTLGASTDGTYAFATSHYDGARREMLYDVAADARVIGGLSVRAGYTSDDLTAHPSAVLGGRYRFLTQERYGLDLGAGLFYMPQDLDGEGMLKASLLVSRRFGDVSLFGNVAYAQDPEGDDHRAEMALGSLVPIVPAITVGLDARARALVFSSDEKHNGTTEPVFDFLAGPLVHCIFRPVTLSAQVGMSGVVIEGPHGSPRPERSAKYGPLGLLSAGFWL